MTGNGLMSESEKEPLTAALERFNRKERNLLFRAVLGNNEERLKMDKEFREKVESKLKITIAPDAWWATDYHINWLAGALAIYTDENKYLGMVQPNEPEDDRALIEGNQEDIDLVIASGRNLILVEAKAYGSWSNSQLEHKMVRFKLLYDYNIKLAREQDAASPVLIHLLLVSPKGSEKITVEYPDWARKDPKDSTFPWIELQLPLPIERILQVNRCECGAKNKPSAEGK